MALLVLPHSDIHLALGNPALSSVEFKLLSQGVADGNGHYPLSDRTATGTYLTFSPHNATGDRLQSAVTVNAGTGTITADHLGTTFIVMKTAGAYIVVRVQVHQDIVGWWFGNDSLTTAIDPDFGHAQPSIYAQFSDDNTGTDLVGDITGHGFVPLTVADTGVCVVDNRDNRARLRGIATGTTTVSGTFLGATQTLSVRVVDYNTTRQNLDVVKRGAKPADQCHNMLFLAEGFTSSQADKDLFARAVREVTNSLFSAHRHEPYGSLKDSFNVYSAYEESAQNLMTVGYKVKDNGDGGVPEGVRLPPGDRDYSVPDGKYSVEQFVRVVGLPKRGENRSTADLKTLWAGQSLTGYDANKVDNGLVNAWKASTSVGIVQARDTFYGLMVGPRYADQNSRADSPSVTRPNSDATTDANLQPFLNAVYNWFRPFDPRRAINADPRRHPPELWGYNQESRDFAIMRYIRGSTLKAAPHTPVGIDWVPAPATFKKSRGLVSIIVNDGVNGGTNINDNTMTCLTINSVTRLGFEYDPANPPTQKKMRRKPANPPTLDVLDTINTVAHEFGHSFALGDEYESHDGDAPATTSQYDNVVNFDTVKLAPAGATGREIDPALVKWAQLPRITRAAGLLAEATKVGANIEVTIDKEWIGPFDVAKHSGETVILRAWNPRDDGEQLHDVTEIGGLTVNSYDYNTGKVVLSGSGIPASLPAGLYGPGSMIYVQRKNESGQALTLVDPRVMAHLTANHLPLNKNTDNQRTSDDNDTPVSINDFKPPCNSSSLIGVFEGAEYYSGKSYRSAGACKMRNSTGGFCHVCKWLITNRVDPNRHIWIDFKFYPKAKKNG